MIIRHVLLIILATTAGFTAFAEGFESNRDHFNSFVLVTPWALSNGSPASSAYTFGLYFNQRIALNVEIGRVSYDYESGDSDSETNYSNIGFGGRYYLRNSLNFIGSVHFRNWQGKRAATTASGANGEVKILADSTVAAIGIGNQWVASYGLTVGIDWVVIAKEISSSTSVSVTRNEGLSSSELQVLKNRAKKEAESVNDVALASAAVVFSLGWSF